MYIYIYIYIYLCVIIYTDAYPIFYLQAKEKFGEEAVTVHASVFKPMHFVAVYVYAYICVRVYIHVDVYYGLYV